MVRIKDIAERAGVSTTTVSNVIHQKTKKVSPENVEKINRLIKEMGYVEKKSLSIMRNDGSKLIAVIANSHKVYEESLLSDPFYGRVIGFIETRLRELGYYMMFYSASDIDDLFHMVTTWDVDGVIAITFPASSCEKIRHYIQKPIVAIDAHKKFSGGMSLTNVGIDNRLGGYMMGKHLLSLGYETILVCAHKDYGNDHLRYEGVVDAVREENRPDRKVQLELIGGTWQYRKKYYSYLVSRIPGFNRKTAAFFLSDFFAMEAISFLLEEGISIPNQIGVCGFDGFKFGSRCASPRLTTINQDNKLKAYLAVDELASQFSDDQYEPTEKLIPLSLISRDSV